MTDVKSLPEVTVVTVTWVKEIWKSFFPPMAPPTSSDTDFSPHRNAETGTSPGSKSNGDVVTTPVDLTPGKETGKVPKGKDTTPVKDTGVVPKEDGTTPGKDTDTVPKEDGTSPGKDVVSDPRASGTAPGNGPKPSPHWSDWGVLIASLMWILTEQISTLKDNLRWKDWTLPIPEVVINTTMHISYNTLLFAIPILLGSTLFLFASVKRLTARAWGSAFTGQARASFTLLFVRISAFFARLRRSTTDATIRTLKASAIFLAWVQDHVVAFLMWAQQVIVELLDGILYDLIWAFFTIRYHLVMIPWYAWIVLGSFPMFGFGFGAFLWHVNFIIPPEFIIWLEVNLRYIGWNYGFITTVAKLRFAQLCRWIVETWYWQIFRQLSKWIIGTWFWRIFVDWLFWESIIKSIIVTLITSFLVTLTVSQCNTNRLTLLTATDYYFFDICGVVVLLLHSNSFPSKHSCHTSQFEMVLMRRFRRDRSYYRKFRNSNTSYSRYPTTS